MKAGWETVTIGDLAEKVTKGTTPTTAGFKYQAAGINFIKVESLDEEGRFLRDKFAYIDEDCHAAQRRSQLRAGDILFSIAGALGRTAIVDDSVIPANTNQALAIIRLKPDLSIERRFIQYALRGEASLDQIEKLRGGAAQQNLSLGQIKDFKIPLPPLEEQRRIVALLDEAFEGLNRARENTETNLTNARELFESLLNAAFEKDSCLWDQLTLDEVSEQFGRGKSRHRPRNDAKLYGGKYPFVQTGDVRNSVGYLTEYTQSYNEVGLAQSKIWPAGTVCITIAANIAETAILSFDACFPDSIIGVVPDEQKALSEYLEYMLRTFSNALKAEGQGSAQDNINMGTFAERRFPFPDLSTQALMAEKLRNAESEVALLKREYQTKLADLEDLRQSLLQKAFAGELT